MMNWRMILYAWHVYLFIFFMWQNKKRVPGSSLGEFSEWLNHVERQLDTVCFCMILAWESKDKTNGVEKKVVPSKDDLKENQVNFDVSGNHSISAISSSTLGTDAVISPGILTSTPIKSNEGRSEMTSNDKTGDKIKIDDFCKRSAKLCQQQDQQQLSSTSDQSSSNKNSGRRLWRLALHKQKVRKTWIFFFLFFLEKLLLSLLLPSSSRNNWLLFHYERESSMSRCGEIYSCRERKKEEDLFSCSSSFLIHLFFGRSNCWSFGRRRFLLYFFLLFRRRLLLYLKKLDNSSE